MEEDTEVTLDIDFEKLYYNMVACRAEWLYELEQWNDILSEEKKTCFFITHDVEEAIILAQRVVIMSARPGRVKEIVPVNIPYPRTQETKMTKEFLDLKVHRSEERRVGKEC